MNNQIILYLCCVFMENWDNIYMRRCLELARKGLGYVAPNPMVGAVVVSGGRIIGEGYHRRFGEAHAEVNAINAVRQPELLRKSMLYVNLEPCAHYGKTPPCAELIIAKQIPKVVVGAADPFAKVDGRGIEMLRKAGVEVTVGVLKAECETLNKRFLTFVTQHRPYIILKWAQSADGFVDRLRQVGDGQTAIRFSNDFTTQLVHKMRAEEAAIVVGTRTKALDQPQLNIRHWHGTNPIRLTAESTKPLPQWMKELYEQGIQSLIVEGGPTLQQSFIDAGLCDEVRVEVSDVRLGVGVKAPDLSLSPFRRYNNFKFFQK
ncbi:bifunctional diaminohydroxyphosphoribosylaminopyrimidine deaminase/5-amino-6-(5-phosphoribosylamino)uracil reductase RibD [Candidatus Symbiothrix dinenymphae]|uniref:bifunctional diaminohydroxyphosphoribosylaminopyrimidine deaminase/5-amino-6-(5-phosphoribosylamino)uracil reductase RibD n=1 Tax=Candidatus Symbiothrix dinenymphae TaxID=467085 RepID=UPI001D03C464|nr:bifunctional diaminohydroxyphosphoribosylaminopyrimidine deaminase/5-amino-6-(5-phosphoribosylamino)uracil reductase RibD [Candidatus Symbiothrix dinenymphae]